MTSRISLIEQKKLQWAKEREEMARINGHSEAPEHRQSAAIRTHIRTFPTHARLLSREESSSTIRNKPLRAVENYGSTTSLRSLVDRDSACTTTSLRTIDFSTGSLVNLVDGTDFSGTTRRRSPSLPPIHTKDNQQQLRHPQENTRELGVEGSRYSNHQSRSQKLQNRQTERNHKVPQEHPYEEREGETSGYGSDSIEAPVPSGSLIGSKRVESEMSERTWQNPYCETPETSLPPSRRLSMGRLGDLNRQRWGSVWGADGTGRPDPPPPSWLERGLSRLDHSSQILVINHDSASSPDSSTTGSTGSDSKTYVRGQNIPMDAQELQEREVKRQRAKELQNAIKQQLEEKDRQRKAERERRLKEEKEEEERINRERKIEKERFQEEQRRIREKEYAKLKKEEAMRESIEKAELQAREDKKKRRNREENREISQDDCLESTCWQSPTITRISESASLNEDFRIAEKLENSSCNEKAPEVILVEAFDSVDKNERHINVEEKTCPRGNGRSEEIDNKDNGLRLPVGKEVAIVLSGRLEDPDFLNRANLQLVNLVVTSPRGKNDNSSTNALNEGLSAFMKSLGKPVIIRTSPRASLSPRIAENRLLTPSKYRNFGHSGRDFGTQTDCESGEIQSCINKDCTAKDRKDVVNNNRRDVEKSTNTGPIEESPIKSLARSKSQPRTSLDSRPRWNANRPGTRYRTQSEKDPHYQRRMRLRRRRVESSDERSRSPSPDRRKSSNQKSKNRNSNRRKVKLDSYDADLSMDSLNSVVPLRIDEQGRVNILNCDGKKRRNKLNDETLDLWCGQEILTQLASLRNGLLSKQREWDPQRCLVSPSTDFY